MSTTLNTRVQSKRDTSANWTVNNPVLLDGEVIIVDTNSGDVRFKVGDGVSTYTQLPFQDEYIQNAITDVDNALSLHEEDSNNPHNVTKVQIGLSNVANVLQYSANNPPPYPVTSVNGDTGAVVLGASDVGAVPSSRTVNSKALSSNITLSASDVGALPTQTGNQGQFLGFTANNVVGAVDAPSGIDVRVSTAQPSGQKTGDFWYQIV